MTRWHHGDRVWREGGYMVTTNRSCNNIPRSALRDGATGVTYLDIRIGDDGWADSVRVSRSSGRADLDRAALACARGWYFREGPVWQQARIECGFAGSCPARVQRIENEKPRASRPGAFSFRPDYLRGRSKRSAFITLVQAATKSFTNFSFESDWA